MPNNLKYNSILYKILFIKYFKKALLKSIKPYKV